MLWWSAVVVVGTVPGPSLRFAGVEYEMILFVEPVVEVSPSAAVAAAAEAKTAEVS